MPDYKTKWLGAEEVGIKPAVLTVDVSVGRKFPAQYRRRPFDAVLKPHEGSFMAVA